MDTFRSLPTFLGQGDPTGLGSGGSGWQLGGDPTGLSGGGRGFLFGGAGLGEQSEWMNRAGDPMGMLSSKIDFGGPVGIDLQNDATRMAATGTGQQSWGNAGAPQGTSRVNGADWSMVNRWDGTVNAAAARFGVPADLLKAHMMIESQGIESAHQVNPNGDTFGLMQINPEIWGGLASSIGADLYTPEGNIMTAAAILKDLYNTHGAQYGWDGASLAYFTGSPDGHGMTGVDTVNGTTAQQYIDLVHAFEGELSANPGGGGQTGQVASGAGFMAITGGVPGPITQEYGMTDFAAGNGAWMYGYTADYSPTRQPIGHAGIDVGVPRGTTLYSPVAGTVVYAGGTGYFKDANGGAGEFRLKLANGDELILGHMEGVSVQVGQKITAGQPIGQSGSFNGDHVHVEYRQYTPGVTNSGFTAIDPRLALGGAGGGGWGGVGSSGGSSSGLPDWSAAMGITF